MVVLLLLVAFAVSSALAFLIGLCSNPDTGMMVHGFMWGFVMACTIDYLPPPWASKKSKWMCGLMVLLGGAVGIVLVRALSVYFGAPT